MIYRCFVAGTIDEKIYQRQLQKNQISQSIVEEFLDAGQSFDRDQLRQVFEFDTDTACSTHDMLQCDCLESGSRLCDGTLHLRPDDPELLRVEPLFADPTVAGDLSFVFATEFHSKEQA